MNIPQEVKVLDGKTIQAGRYFYQKDSYLNFLLFRFYLIDNICVKIAFNGKELHVCVIGKGAGAYRHEIDLCRTSGFFSSVSSPRIGFQFNIEDIFLDDDFLPFDLSHYIAILFPMGVRT